MKFNISYPLTGAQKCIEIDDDKKVSIFYDRRMAHEIEGDGLGDDYKGYIFKITGGNDKDGFPMRQGISVKGRTRVLLDKNQKCFRPRRDGQRKRKSVRGCIVGPDIQVLALAIVKKGDQDIPGLTDITVPRRLGPKRVNKIRKLFALKKTDDIALVKKNVVRRKWTAPNGKQRQKAPKIQRIITDARLRRKRIYKAEKKQKWVESRKQVEDYNKLVQDWSKKKLSDRKKELLKRAELEAAKKAGTAPTKGKQVVPDKKGSSHAQKATPAQTQKQAQQQSKAPQPNQQTKASQQQTQAQKGATQQKSTGKK